MELTHPALRAFMAHTGRLFHLSRIGIENEKIANGMVILYESVRYSLPLIIPSVFHMYLC